MLLAICVDWLYKYYAMLAVLREYVVLDVSFHEVCTTYSVCLLGGKKLSMIG